MTTIATVPGIDNTKLTQLARSLILNADDPENTKLLKAFNVVVDGTPPQVVTLSFDELEGLVNIMDLQRPIKARLEPAQWVIMTYQLNDLTTFLEEGYRLTGYTLSLNAVSKILTFEGVITHINCIPEHPEFNPNAVSVPKLFVFTLCDFNILQQMAITRVMATRDSKFDPVAGTFDISWVYEFKNGTVTFATEGPEE